MEALIGIGSLILSLFITALSVKLVAGWLRAERTGWGHCIAALLLAYITATAIAVGTTIGIGIASGAGLLPESLLPVEGMVAAASRESEELVMRKRSRVVPPDA